MAVNVQAGGGGGANLSVGGGLDLSQVGTNSPAMWSGVLMVGLLVVIILVALSLR